MSDFDRAVDIVLRLEDATLSGKVTNDTGGLTRYGISQRAYPSTDIANLTLDQAKFLYHSDYWNPASCDGLSWPLSLFVFDAAINQGVDAAIRMLQQEAGTAIDGILGVQTLKAISKHDTQELAALFLARRALRYTGTKNFDQYGRGWLARLMRIAMKANVA